MNPLELFKLVQNQYDNEQDQIHALAALADAPPEDYQATISLPVQNPIPAYRLGDGGLGSLLANTNYGVPAPVLGQEKSGETLSIGELLVGEINANAN